MTCMASSERQPFPSRLSFTLRKRGLLHLLCSWWGNKERRAAGPGEGPSGNHERRESARGGAHESSTTGRGRLCGRTAGRGPESTGPVWCRLVKVTGLCVRQTWGTGVYQ